MQHRIFSFIFAFIRIISAELFANEESVPETVIHFSTPNLLSTTIATPVITSQPLSDATSTMNSQPHNLPTIKTNPNFVRTLNNKVKPLLTPPLPFLPLEYSLELEVLDLHNNESFFVIERENDARAVHDLNSKQINISCIYNAQTGEGYLVEGVKCGRYSGLPKKCFCTSKFCRPYVAVTEIFQHLRLRNVTANVQNIGETNSQIIVWKSTTADMTVEAIYSRTGTNQPLNPISFSVRGSGRVFSLPGGAIWLQYQVRSWRLESGEAHDLVSTPEGVFCPALERKLLPKLANQFSLTMETIIQNMGTIAYESQHYEADEKLVAYTYRPHLHSDGMFMINIPGLSEVAIESYLIVHDFKTGVQYMINERTSNCSIQGIPISAMDSAPIDSQHIRLRHASELISIDPNMFIYKGTRTLRSVLCDVWVAERGIRKGQYATVEIYFSHENWTVEMEVFNKRRQVPMGVSSYIADADNPNRWTSVVHTFFYEYSDGHPTWRHFDVSPCLSRINRLFLVFTLEVSYSELVQYNLEAAKNSIRRAIAGIAGVSPLRISDIFLGSRSTTGEVDVWFVLLEKPDITGPVMTPRPQLQMAEAYGLLADITHKHNVSVKLDLSPTKKLFATIKRGSLETTAEGLHPHMRHKSMRYLKAGYTAGSMAGLGFSMAILGTCVGIFTGFLLWRRHASVPYKITD